MLPQALHERPYIMYHMNLFPPIKVGVTEYYSTALALMGSSRFVVALSSLLFENEQRAKAQLQTHQS
jgi:hypothetical protein